MPSSQDFNVAFQALQPDLILSSVEDLGYRTDGRLLALNSYENRVYRVGLEDEAPLVAKFYRPGRWSDDAILEEHGITLDLAAEEIPVVAPSLGGIETLVTLPATTSHAGLDPDERRRIGVSDSLIRLSVGIEASDDLIADLDQALNR